MAKNKGKIKAIKRLIERIQNNMDGQATLLGQLTGYVEQLEEGKAKTPKQVPRVAVRCVNDRYDPDGNIYASTGAFLSMCVDCFGVLPTLRKSGPDTWVDKHGEVTLVRVDSDAM